MLTVGFSPSTQHCSLQTSIHGLDPQTLMMSFLCLGPLSVYEYLHRPACTLKIRISTVAFLYAWAIQLRWVPYCTKKYMYDLVCKFLSVR